MFIATSKFISLHACRSLLWQCTARTKLVVVRIGIAGLRPLNNHGSKGAATGTRQNLFPEYVLTWLHTCAARISRHCIEPSLVLYWQTRLTITSIYLSVLFSDRPSVLSKPKSSRESPQSQHLGLAVDNSRNPAAPWSAPSTQQQLQTGYRD